MLRLIKAHQIGCTKTSTTDFKCVSKVAGKKVCCAFTIVGPDPRFPGEGKKYKKSTETGDERVAREELYLTEQRLRNPETAHVPVHVPAPKKSRTIDEAVALFLATKTRISPRRQTTLKRQLGRMVDYLKTECKRVTLLEVERADLQAYMNTWTGEYNTLVKTRENLSGFWGYSFDEGWTTRHLAKRLPNNFKKPVKARVPTFTQAEGQRIIETARKAVADGELFKREGINVARMVLAFTLVEKFTGFAVSDVTKLRFDEIEGKNVMTNRKKTGVAVYPTLQPAALVALDSFVPMGKAHYFWSGNGLLQSRVAKWHIYLAKLYTAAQVRIDPTTERSTATPHYWRHTFVRDCRLKKMNWATIADLIGDDEEAVKKYYSTIDEEMQEKIRTDSASVFEDDPFTQRLNAELNLPSAQ